MNTLPCINWNQCTPTLMRCLERTKLTSSFNDLPRKSSVRSQPDHNTHKKQKGFFLLQFLPWESQQHVFPFCWMLTLVCMVVVWYCIWGAVNQVCHEHIPLATWLMNVEHAGNVRASEPHWGHTPARGCTSLGCGENVVWQTSGWVHICVLKQGVSDAEGRNTIYWTQLMSGWADGNHIMQLF